MCQRHPPRYPPGRNARQGRERYSSFGNRCSMLSVQEASWRHDRDGQGLCKSQHRAPNNVVAVECCPEPASRTGRRQAACDSLRRRADDGVRLKRDGASIPGPRPIVLTPTELVRRTAIIGRL